MAEISIIYKIYLEDPSKVEEVKEEINEKFKPRDITIEDIGFGVKLIKALFILDEDEGISKFEEKLKGIKGISNIETESVTRL